MAKIAGVQEVRLDKLVLYDNNAKLHDIDTIVESIKTFGFVSPCLIDKKYNVIAGHGRIEAAKSLGMDAVPCVFVEGLSDEQRRAYILIDNKLTELGGWDLDKLNFELGEIGDIDMSEFGFDAPIELDDFTEKKADDANDDDEVEPEDEPRVYCCPKCGFKFEIPK